MGSGVAVVGACCKGACRKEGGISSRVGASGRVGAGGRVGTGGRVGASSRVGAGSRVGISYRVGKDVFRLSGVPLHGALSIVYSGGVGE
jgi:UDP-3-O-[3-hydroxymyristoyl] glucosamine N-acyltransferase